MWISSIPQAQTKSSSGLHGIPRGLEGEELWGIGVVLPQLHEQDSRRAGWRSERALSSPSDRGIRDRGDCQARCRSSQRKDEAPHFGQIVGRVDPPLPTGGNRSGC